MSGETVTGPPVNAFTAGSETSVPSASAVTGVAFADDEKNTKPSRVLVSAASAIIFFTLFPYPDLSIKNFPAANKQVLHLKLFFFENKTLFLQDFRGVNYSDKTERPIRVSPVLDRIGCRTSMFCFGVLATLGGTVLPHYVEDGYQSLCRLWIDDSGTGNRQLLHLDQRSDQDGNVPGRSPGARRRPFVCTGMSPHFARLR